MERDFRDAHKCDRCSLLKSRSLRIFKQGCEEKGSKIVVQKEKCCPLRI